MIHCDVDAIISILTWESRGESLSLPLTLQLFMVFMVLFTNKNKTCFMVRQRIEEYWLTWCSSNITGAVSIDLSNCWIIRIKVLFGTASGVIDGRAEFYYLKSG